MVHFEKELSRKEFYHGYIVDFCVHQVELEDGKTASREVVHHHGGVSVVALDEKGRLLLVRQFRFAAGKELLEIPAGKLEQGEDPMAAAARELEEETGYQAESLELLTEMIPTPGYCTEVIRIYLARGFAGDGSIWTPGNFCRWKRWTLPRRRKWLSQDSCPMARPSWAFWPWRPECRREKASECDEK